MRDSIIVISFVVSTAACNGKKQSTTIPPSAPVAPTSTGSQDSQRQVITEFYKAVLQDDRGGLPSEALMRNAAPFLSKGLFALIVEARSEEKKAIARVKDFGPSPYEGFPFVSPGEGATNVTKITSDPKFSPSSYLVDLCSISKVDQKPYEPMKIRVLLINEGSHWVIDDIHYYQDVPNPTPEGLRSYLNSGLKDLRSTK